MIDSSVDCHVNAARQPDGMAEATMLLAEHRRMEPSRLEKWVFYAHPSGRSRIAMAMRWKAESLMREREHERVRQSARSSDLPDAVHG